MASVISDALINAIVNLTQEISKCKLSIEIHTSTMYINIHTTSTKMLFIKSHLVYE